MKLYSVKNRATDHIEKRNRLTAEANASAVLIWR